MAALVGLSALSLNACRLLNSSVYKRCTNPAVRDSTFTACTCNVGAPSHIHCQTSRVSGGRDIVISHSPRRFECRSSETNAILSKDELFKDAAKAGDLNALRELVGTGEVDINLPSPARAGWTALQLAAFYDHSEVTSYLLWAGADTEVRNNSGNTALQFACLKGNVQIAKILLEAGADLGAASNDKGTAYEYAQEWGGGEIVDFLLLWAASQTNS